MSSILDALEKASKAKQARAGSTEDRLAQERERRLREMEEKHRRQMRLALLAGAAFFGVLVLGGVVLIGVLLSRGRDDRPQEMASVVVDQMGARDAPSDMTGGTIKPATPTLGPTPTPAITPTPTPSPTPMPTQTPVAAVEVPARPTATPRPTPRITPRPTPRFAENQLISPADLGVEIKGALILGADSMVLIDDEELSIGRKYKGIRPLDIRSGMIEAEVDDAGGPVKVYIRY
ncbi:MAG: hypothetical protein RLY93_14545 [Sumerlaeia bacterium]